MTLATDYIRKICLESLVKTFLNPESELYIGNITGEQWYELIKKPELVDTALLEEAFETARGIFAEQQAEAKEKKEYYKMLEEEYAIIKKESEETVRRLREKDCDNIDAWYNQGE